VIVGKQGLNAFPCGNTQYLVSRKPNENTRDRNLEGRQWPGQKSLYWKKSLEGISLNNHRVSLFMRHGVQCGFVGILTEYLPWSTEKIPPGDPTIEILPGQIKKSPAARPKIASGRSKKGVL